MCLSRRRRSFTMLYATVTIDGYVGMNQHVLDTHKILAQVPYLIFFVPLWTTCVSLQPS